LAHLLTSAGERALREAVPRKAPTWTADTWALVELCHVLVVATWKMNRGAESPPHPYGGEANHHFDWDEQYSKVRATAVFIIHGKNPAISGIKVGEISE
jgi:hypothetical protein